MSVKQDAIAIVNKFIGELDGAFNGQPKPMPVDIRLTTDSAEALSFAHKGTKHKNTKRLHVLGEKWVASVYSESARVAELYQYDNPGLALAFIKEKDRLYEVLDNILAKSRSSQFGELMHVYVPFILHARAGDPKNILATKLVSILCARGIPCGCYGTWPESPIVVYWPWKKEEPVFEK